MSLEEMIAWISSPIGLAVAGIAIFVLVGIEVAFVFLAIRAIKNRSRNGDGKFED